ncbi:putative TOR1-1-phosphatidylinositol 3-kinase [Microstroma glucosiphilum]|uniref:Serine/threonine-protein kinase TOR n=1 Tax=Pseudomicrostroma glucosiphilum TaxID=1684307 RepID=A0A316UDJ8_9BASI|nr:putative TOR1-1-phosphatidylinositol 3-kinase [Pseudomicrostroma glucosiphilum]PWN23279.1 putative TOR1-1-phosphatidylinositol 3-kinase [Pseudomicrostroma glucosiphilum]
MAPPGVIAHPHSSNGLAVASSSSSATTNTVGVSAEALTRIFSNLKSKDELTRISAGRELGHYVTLAAPGLQGDSLNVFNNDLNRRIFELTHSPNAHEKLGGIIAIESLIDLESEDNSARLYRFYQYLKPNLPCNDPQVMIAASKALGRVSKIGGHSLGDQFIEFEVLRALDFLQAGDRNESGRYAAVLIIREMARNVPHLFHVYVPRVLERIWVALRDTRLMVREGGAEALGACLQIIAAREKQMGTQLCELIDEEAEKGLKQPAVETAHGSMMAVQELLQHSRSFMKSRFHRVCELILRLHRTKDPLIKRTVTSMIPVLANYDPQFFGDTHLYEVMNMLTDQLRKDRDKATKESTTQIFETIGLVSAAMGTRMKQYIDSVLACVKDALQSRNNNKQRNATTVPEAPVFFCIGHLAAAVGPHLTKYMHELLDLMFACGLSEALVMALERLVRAIPPLLRIVQDRLLDMLSMTLIGQPYRALGAPNPFIRHNAEITVPTSNMATITVALETLGAFDFSGHILNEFARNCTLPYLEDDNSEIRKAAAVTCARLFSHDPICYQTSMHAIEVVNDVLDKLMTVGIADPNAELRKTVLSALDERFDRHLAQSEYVRSLFVALNDENFAVREIAIIIIGRLAKHNPAYVMPSLRKALIQLLTELEYSTVSRNKEDAAKLLTEVFRASSRLVKSYALPMLEILLPRANDPSPGVAARVMECLGELAKVGGEDLLPHVEQLVKLAIEQLAGHSAAQASTMKRDAALRTLGLVASNTGHVVEPYLKYRNLLATIVKILRTENSPAVRRESIRVMGILGALDPYRYKVLEKHVDDGIVTTTQGGGAIGAGEVTNKDSLPTDLLEMAMTMGTSSDEFYQSVTIEALLAILKDLTLPVHHHAVIEAIMYMFKTQGMKCVPFLPQIIPAFLDVIKNCTTSLAEFYWQQLGILISIIKQHARNYLNEIFGLVREHWSSASNTHIIQLTIVSVVEAVAKALEGEFKSYLPILLPNMLQTFQGELNQKRQQPTLMRILHAFTVFGSSIEEYLHLILPPVVELFERPDASLQLRKTAITTVAQLTRKVNFCDHASRVIQPLVRILKGNNSELRVAALDTLAALIYQLGPSYAIFVPVVNKVVAQNRIPHAKYDTLVRKLLDGEKFPPELGPTDGALEDKTDDAPLAEATKMSVNQLHLRQAWDTSKISTADDWREWLRRMAVEFMRESPSHALRACRSLADVYHPLAYNLMNTAFVSCWPELFSHYQDDLVRAIETAFDAPEVPDEVVMRLLNLAEFMEHDDKALPVDIRLLGQKAFKFHSYAKSLHYYESMFLSGPSADIVENLIDINSRLGNQDAAFGTLTYAREQLDIVHHEEWFEKLGRWEDALVAYDRKAAATGSEPLESTFGRMRCLHALAEWENLSTLVQDKWVTASGSERTQMAPLACAAAWALGQWDAMEEFIASMRSDSSERSFYRAILHVHRSQRQQANKHITRARDSLDQELTALINESYTRAYGLLVRTQMLSELEEALIYKLDYREQPDRQATMRSTWMKRLKGCQPDVEVWQRILSVRSIVLTPADDTETWIKFANLCRKSGRMVLAEKTLNSLLGPDSTANGGQMDTHSPSNAAGGPKAPPQVIYAHLKFMWASGAKLESLNYLRDFTVNLAEDLGLHGIDERGNLVQPDWQASPKLAEYARLLARCYFKQGEWQAALNEDWVTDDSLNVINSYHRATELDRSWYKAWHAWALANFDVISHHERLGNDITPQMIAASIVPSVQGFFRSIALASGNSLQDTLRLLTLWFKFGYQENVAEAVSEGFNSVIVDTWLEVVPQIIARINMPSARVRRLIHHLLSNVGTAHPQALVYPLTVAAKSPSLQRIQAAMAIMNNVREHSPRLVEQALLVSNELIRVAILWHELWHEGLEEASRLYFTEHNIDGMFATLEPLHEALEKGPETLRETSFVQTHGRDLAEAREYGRRYRQHGEIGDLNQAWDLYYHVFKRIAKQLPATNSVQLDLQYVSPKLLALRNLELAVPGTYHSGQPIVRISTFEQTVLTISSKQRPRRLKMKGSDGRTYQYLLKGHEDLRQDERVMQLFGLVNTLLSIDSECYKRRLDIRRYPVIPLSPNTGMLGWVENTDTLHVLIKEYREQHKILLNIEHRLMLQMAPDYDHIPLLHKVEVFEYALDNTPGQDLYRVLWLKSHSSEAWLERRTNYTRSLATSSVAGYILGLGDRHPSNLLLDRLSGQIIHIDFGDCFEVARQRPKFPERVPFRLTRMLVNAMEVGGVKGAFKVTSENVMRVLRDNKESVLALLEAFVHDPLISWRLVADEANEQQRAPDASEHEGVGVGGAGPRQMGDVRNQRALEVVRRIQNKLNGRDYGPQPLSVSEQMSRLIEEATNNENLAGAFIGFCSFW